MKQNRSKLKGYFKKGAIPTEANYADLIDSMITQDEDSVAKLPNEPLRIIANGAEEALLNFYPAEQTQSTPSWQVRQKPGGKPGLSIADSADNRLFIEGGNGNVGIGTTAPGAKLRVQGVQDRVSLHVGDGSGNDFTMDVAGGQGLVSLVAGARIKPDGTGYTFLGTRGASKLTLHDGQIKFHTSDATSGAANAEAAGLANPKMVLTNEGNLGIGAAAPEVKLEVSGDSLIGGKLKVSGDLTVQGNAITAGSVYAGGNPVVYENFEIYLRGSAFESLDGNNTYLRVANQSMNMDTSRGINTVILNPNGTFKAKATYDLYGNAGLWNDWATWVNNIAANGDIVASASFDALNNAVLGGAAESLLRSIGAVEAFSAVKGHQRSPYVLLFIKGGKAAEVSVPYRGANAQLKTTYYDLLNNNVHGDDFVRRSPLYHRMYPDNPLVYQDIFDAKNAGAVVKFGNPQYDETTYTNKNLWNERPIIRFGSDNEADGNGALVTIPPGYDTVWVRVLGDRWTAMKAYFTDGAKEDLGLWPGGYRATNCYCPDGSLSDGVHFSTDNQNRTAHQWLPIPAGRSGQLALVAKPNTNWHFWVSGLAFSRNPWGHAGHSAVAYHWGLNGSERIKWNTHIWNDDVLAEITAKTNSVLVVPVVPNGRDKLLYLVEHNNNWNGAMHNGITVNGTPIERFLATYDNPFARHWNSKFYERYFAARIPAGLIDAKSRWLKVKIDMSKQTNSIYFREIGTHDLDTPLG